VQLAAFPARSSWTKRIFMTRLLITRGLPASGKTTFARKLQPRVVRVNRDDLRLMLHGRRLFTETAEGQVTTVQRMTVEALLAQRADVIVDDTNLRGSTVREWALLAARFRATFEVHDLTEVPLDECLRRDAARPSEVRVGERTIRRMHDRYIAGRNLPLPIPYVDPDPVTYDPDPALPPAVLVDIDGTVALMGDRTPYDWLQVGSDAPNPAVIEAVRAMHGAGNAVVFCTGRDEEARTETEAWLDLFVGVPYEGLFMRPPGDNRRDAIVKREIFETEIHGRWRIAGVFDDRRQVVRMWRELGLTVFHVAEGDF
jgi:predicted kinase